jgi:multiple sugar transport system permease protein
VEEMINQRKFKWLGYLLVLPAVLYMLILVGYPIVYNFLISFQNVELTNLASGLNHYIGFHNYNVMLHKSVFWISLRNTFVYTVCSILFQFIFGFGLALFFNLKFKLSAFLRGLMLVSWLIPVVVTALLFKFMFSTSVGIINYFLLSLHLIHAPLDWLTNPTLAMVSIVIANIWIGIPFNMILLSTGIDTLPQDVYESAGLDGASRWQKLIYITLPLLRPTIMVVMILGFIYTFKVFDLIYVMTGGGPINATEVLSTLSYRISFDQYLFSSGAAVSDLLFIILLIVSLVYLKMIRNDEVM